MSLKISLFLSGHLHAEPSAGIMAVYNMPSFRLYWESMSLCILDKNSTHWPNCGMENGSMVKSTHCLLFQRIGGSVPCVRPKQEQPTLQIEEPIVLMPHPLQSRVSI